jgi:hypothetical protein
MCANLFQSEASSSYHFLSRYTVNPCGFVVSSGKTYSDRINYLPLDKIWNNKKRKQK